MRSLAATKHYALRQIEEFAGRTRLRYISDGPGQQGARMQKLLESKSYLNSFVAGVPTVQPGPYLVADAARTGRTATAVATEVMQAAQAWDGQIDPQIEAERVGGRKDVRAAQTAEQVQTALDAAEGAFGAL